MRGLIGLLLVVPLIGGCAFGGSTTHKVHLVAQWMTVENLPPKARPGARLFATVGCTACHTYDGAGRSNLGAPDLTAIGSRHLGIRFQLSHLRCPSCVIPGSPMPPFKSLGNVRLHQLTVFLESSKGKH